MAEGKLEQAASAESSPQIKNFFNLSAEDQETLRANIAKHGGLVRIFVHPFFNLSQDVADWDEVSEATLKKIRRVDTAIGKALESDSSQKPAIIIFEDERRLAQDLGRYYTSLKIPPYIIPTYRDTPVPKIDNTVEPPYSDDAAKEALEIRNWPVVLEKLKELGIRKILIGGLKLTAGVPGRLTDQRRKELDEEHDAYRKGRRLAGKDALNYYVFDCVGGAIRKLSTNFSVEVSNLAFPSQGSKIRKMETRQEPDSPSA